ncbi:hypothetical protein [Curtobacterium sp. MCPF17_018]|uniref:hypothetical protein n=1 Tax=Curtobacterium sp. MCPF17_018 TaxID=2175638 RepID=UPI0011B843EC|nr:hypothetical protein [Curtobacterium sp. MCPF17_018]
MATSLSAQHEAGLRHLVLLEQADAHHVAAAAATGTNLFRGLPLSHVYGYHHIADDLVALGLARTALGGYTPTDAGRRALANIDAAAEAAARRTPDSDPVAVIGVAREPVFYSAVLTQLIDLPDVLIVDPYLGADDVRVLARITSVSRVLTGPRPVKDRNEKSPESRLQHLALAVGTRPDLKVRLTTTIHDRYMLPSEGAGLMLGASLGGSKVTTAIELSEDATADHRGTFDTIWADAEPVEPIIIPG